MPGDRGLLYFQAFSLLRMKGDNMDTRMNRSHLQIGTYVLQPYARTERHIRELAECGIDFVVSMSNDRSALDLFEKYGIGAVVSGVLPGWWGGRDQAGSMERTNLMEHYKEGAARFQDHPAVWGVSIGDEPSALDLPYCGRIADYVKQLCPQQFPFLNLFPCYGTVAWNSPETAIQQLGCGSYREYIDTYCRYVDTDYICYDFYLYSQKERNVEQALENLQIVSDACRKTERDLWIVLQVNSNQEDRWISENQLRFQAYSAMAYGAKVILWACYTAGWWKNQVLDGNGEKTKQYEKLKKINGELKQISQVYDKYTCAATYVIDGDERREKELTASDFKAVRAEHGERLIAGHMVSKDDGSSALMLCAADDPFDERGNSFQVILDIQGRNVSAFGGNGRIPVTNLGENRFAVRMESCQGVLVVAR